MTSSQSIAVAALFSFALGSPTAWADPASDACAALASARTALYSMISAKDVSAQDALNAKVREASTKLDSVLAGMTGADAKAAADFKALWDQFKATRDNQIIPAIIRATPPRRRRSPMASNPSACPRCGASCIMSCKVR